MSSLLMVRNRWLEIEFIKKRKQKENIRCFTRAKSASSVIEKTSCSIESSWLSVHGMDTRLSKLVNRVCRTNFAGRDGA